MAAEIARLREALRRAAGLMEAAASGLAETAPSAREALMDGAARARDEAR